MRKEWTRKKWMVWDVKTKCMVNNEDEATELDENSPAAEFRAPESPACMFSAVGVSRKWKLKEPSGW